MATESSLVNDPGREHVTPNPKQKEKGATSTFPVLPTTSSTISYLTKHIEVWANRKANVITQRLVMLHVTPAEGHLCYDPKVQLQKHVIVQCLQLS